MLDVVILTYQEEENLPYTLASLDGLDCAVYVVDSGSIDRTVDIAQTWGAVVVSHPFESQARQINWALDTLPLTAPWTLRLDADERLTDELRDELARRLHETTADTAGFLIKRRVYFWNCWIRFGGYYPTWLLRLWRRGCARCEDAWMDEHMIVSGGRIDRMEHDFIDENHKGLGFWIDKHNRYADREVRMIREGIASQTGADVGAQVARKRYLKKVVYGRAPLFVRALIYWFFRYFLLLGFLDGRAGFVFHFMQALWYRTLVDAKLIEVSRDAPLSSRSTGQLK